MLHAYWVRLKLTGSRLFTARLLSHPDRAMIVTCSVSLTVKPIYSWKLTLSRWFHHYLRWSIVIKLILVMLLYCRGRSQSDSGNSSSMFSTRTGPAVVQCWEERPVHLWRPHMEDAASQWVSQFRSQWQSMHPHHKTNQKMKLQSARFFT